jgi:cysteine-S-conjugate beta-lyase
MRVGERRRTSGQQWPALSRDAVDDPFGLTGFGVADVVGRPGEKWSKVDGRLASWVADMDFPIAPAIVERLTRRVALDVGYPTWDDVSRSPLPERFAERMSERFGWSPEPSRLHELTDVLQGVALAVHHLTAPGDGVVLHVPAYPPFLDLVRTTERRLVEIPGVATSGSFAWDYEELDGRLAGAARGTGRARLWILCHPQNPTGRVFGRAELEVIAELAARHDLTVVSDEIHADLVHHGNGHVPFASLGAEAAARTITVTSGSKAYNLAGLRWAILHAGPDLFHETVAALPSHYLGTPNLLAVEATDAAWSEGAEWLASVRRVLDDNRHRLRELLAEQLPGVVYHVPEATYLAWLDCRALGLGDDPAATFRERGVELAAGPRFGAVGAGHARLNFATSPAVLEAIVGAMAGEPSYG